VAAAAPVVERIHALSAGRARCGRVRSARMGLKGIGRFMMGVAIGAVIALIVARKTVGEGREVFNLQRGPTMLAMVIGALGGGLTLSLADKNSKAAAIVASITALALAFVVLVIDTNAANVL
jgi:ABC-type spermidine/putrescine transport system permease subunit II